MASSAPQKPDQQVITLDGYDTFLIQNVLMINADLWLEEEKIKELVLRTNLPKPILNPD